MNRSFAIFCLLVLLLGGVGYWQRERVTKLLHKSGGSPANDAGGGDGKSKPLAPVEINNIKVSGIIHSAHPSAVLEAFGTVQTVMVGDQIMLPLARGKVLQPARCERIEPQAVTLYFPSNDFRVTVQLSK